MLALIHTNFIISKMSIISSLCIVRDYIDMINMFEGEGGTFTWVDVQQFNTLYALKPSLTKKQINRVLYDMRKKGTLTMNQSTLHSRPIFQIASASSSSSSSSSPKDKFMQGYNTYMLNDTIAEEYSNPIHFKQVVDWYNSLEDVCKMVCLKFRPTLFYDDSMPTDLARVMSKVITTIQHIHDLIQ